MIKDQEYTWISSSTGTLHAVPVGHSFLRADGRRVVRVEALLAYVAGEPEPFNSMACAACGKPLVLTDNRWSVTPSAATEGRCKTCRRTVAHPGFVEVLP